MKTSSKLRIRYSDEKTDKKKAEQLQLGGILLIILGSSVFVVSSVAALGILTGFAEVNQVIVIILGRVSATQFPSGIMLFLKRLDLIMENTSD